MKGRERDYWIGTEIGMLGGCEFQIQVTAGDGSFKKGKMGAGYNKLMIAQDLVIDVFIVTHSMRQISTLAHIEAVAPMKLIPSSPSASDLNDWRMALQQGIRERLQVLREAHRLQRTELLQKLRDRCRERMNRPGEREIQELMGTRVKQDAPDYRASRNPAKKHPDNLSGRLSRAKWSSWLKCVLGDEVDRCLHQMWGSDEEWDGVDDQQGKPHRYCTDYATRD